MASTYSSLKFELIGTGEQEGIWGDTTNTNVGTAIEQAITGSGDVTFASADVTLTLTNTPNAQIARNLRLVCVGVSDGARQLIVPAIEKQYIIQNNLDDTVTIKPPAGATGIAVPSGKTMVVFNNGTNIVEVTTYAANLAVGGAFSSGGNLSALNISTANVTATGAGAFTGNVSAANISTANVAATGNSAVTGNSNVGGVLIVTGNANVGGNLTVTGSGSFSATSALKIPVGTTGQQPSPVTGQIRYNTTINQYEGYFASAWGQLGGGATGGGGNQVFVLNDQTVTVDYTIPSGKNAMCAGPITVGAGINVTVSTGSNWVVV
jgi:hypothetical protein